MMYRIKLINSKHSERDKIYDDQINIHSPVSDKKILKIGGAYDSRNCSLAITYLLASSVVISSRGDSPFDHKNHDMVQKIRNSYLISSLSGFLALDKNDLSAHSSPTFLRILSDAFLKEIVGIGTFLWMQFAVGNDIIHILKYEVDWCRCIPFEPEA